MKKTRKQVSKLVKNLSTDEIIYITKKDFGFLWTLLCTEALDARMFSSSSRYEKQVISQ